MKSDLTSNAPETVCRPSSTGTAVSG